MTTPTRRTAWLAAAGALPLAAAYWRPEALAAAVAVDVVLLALYFLESARLAAVEIRLIPNHERSCRVGERTEAGYWLENRGASTLRARLRQPWPTGWTGEGSGVEVAVPPRSGMAVTFPATAGRRGRVVLPAPEVTTYGPGGWFARRERADAGASVLVYPDLSRLGDVEHVRRGRGLTAHGIRRQRQVGAGSEFERVRAYLPDDDYRHINWKTTARAGRPVTNVYQAEKGRDVILCIDCGRLMGQTAGGEARGIDMAAESGLVLARAVVKDGDRVGYAGFSSRVHEYLPAKGGRAGGKRVADAVAGVDVVPETTSFAALTAVIGARQTRRALLVVFTDFSEPQVAVDLAEAMAVLGRRHAALVVGLRDPALDRIAAATAGNRDGRCRILAARTLRDERDAAAQELRKQGVSLIECAPGAMAARTLDRYLAIKASERF